MKSAVNPFAKAGLFIVVCSWLIYTSYWFINSFGWVQRLSTYGFLATVDVVGTVGLGFRTAAGLIAIVAVIGFLRRREPSRLFKLVGLAVLLEAIYSLSLIPAAIFGCLARNLMFLMNTGIPYLVGVTIIPATLLKLRSKLTSSSSKSHSEAVNGVASSVSHISSFSGLTIPCSGLQLSFPQNSMVLFMVDGGIKGTE